MGNFINIFIELMKKATYILCSLASLAMSGSSATAQEFLADAD